MVAAVGNVLEILNSYGIEPGEDFLETAERPPINSWQAWGEVLDGETVYSTSPDGETFLESEVGDERLLGLLNEVQSLLAKPPSERQFLRESVISNSKPPEPYCAWYSPVHFFGSEWGIYIREECILSVARAIALFVDPHMLSLPPLELLRQLLRSAFFYLYLHEQFHHKVESLGFRLLVASGDDRYRPYKRDVYRPLLGTSDCIEESLANADAYNRLGEPRYLEKLDPAVRGALRTYLKATIPSQPPGYAEGLHYVAANDWRRGLYNLQSQVRDGRFPPSTPESHWSVAPNMITSLMPITDNIFVILPVGATPIFRVSLASPGFTTSTRRLESALTKHYGYTRVPGGKGSHVKLKKPGAPTIHLPGDRKSLTPGAISHALDALGGISISLLPAVLDGRAIPDK